MRHGVGSWQAGTTYGKAYFVSDLFNETGTTAHKKKRKSWIAILIALAVLVAGGAFVVNQVTGALSAFGPGADYSGEGEAEIAISIPKGASGTRIGEILVDKDVVKSQKAWDSAVHGDSRSSSIQPGTYPMKTQLPAAKALEILVDPDSLDRKFVSVPEGQRLSEQVATLAAATGIAESEFNDALAKPENLGLASYSENRPEGFLFPDSYEYNKSTSATALLKKMADRFNTVSDEVSVQEGAQAIGITPYEVVTIAGIIEKEVRIPEDRPKVARVLLNRVAKGQPMQLDSTVHYAANKPAGAPLTRAEFESPNPYNTYTNPGLPPGPISAPGKAALEAAANPADGPWLYFVTVNLETGETRFTEDYAEHERNVADYESWCDANGNPSGC